MATGRIPLEVGTRGTIGSLLKREIEYFRKLDTEPGDSKMNSDRQCQEMKMDGCPSWPSFRFSRVPWKRKKRRSSGITPGICSLVEVANSPRLDEIPGFSYQNLRADSKRYDV
ncbi:uncharacterized protein LOC127247405 [Andrographis paniculata]|uniref:uncharacterized protein LOC127247405 n=1 Tax=Andrographis paniculata TaxID=175694 RepID=UPI0021E71EAF|nr:uncharacterized protein LOC127247405 [Andrographis paniculata]